MAICSVVVAPDETFAVNKGETVTVDEICRTTFFLRWNFFCCDLEPMPRQTVNILLATCQENPLAINGIVVFSELPQNFRRVSLWVNGDADDNYVGLVDEGFLNLLHVLVHRDADSSTRGEEKFRHPNLAPQIFKPKGSPVMVSEQKVRDFVIDREPSSPLLNQEIESDKDRCNYDEY